MPPTPLITKGTGTLARKWRKIKKRCSSFSSGDAVQRGGQGQNRSADSGADYNGAEYNDDDDVFTAAHDDEGIAIGEIEQVWML
jgi:hypothetical protein